MKYLLPSVIRQALFAFVLIIDGGKDDLVGKLNRRFRGLLKDTAEKSWVGADTLKRRAEDFAAGDALGVPRAAIFCVGRCKHGIWPFP